MAVRTETLPRPRRFAQAACKFPVIVSMTCEGYACDRVPIDADAAMGLPPRVQGMADAVQARARAMRFSGMHGSGRLYVSVRDGTPLGGKSCTEHVRAQNIGRHMLLTLNAICNQGFKRVEVSEPPPTPEGDPSFGLLFSQGVLERRWGGA